MEENLREVTVFWRDAWGDDGHLEVEVSDDFVPAERRNRGYLLREDDDKIIITQGTIKNLYKGKVLIDGFLVIPKGMITKVKDD